MKTKVYSADPIHATDAEQRVSKTGEEINALNLRKVLIKSVTWPRIIMDHLEGREINGSVAI